MKKTSPPNTLLKIKNNKQIEHAQFTIPPVPCRTFPFLAQSSMKIISSPVARDDVLIRRQRLKAKQRLVFARHLRFFNSASWCKYVLYLTEKRKRIISLTAVSLFTGKTLGCMCVISISQMSGICCTCAPVFLVIKNEAFLPHPSCRSIYYGCISMQRAMRMHCKQYAGNSRAVHKISKVLYIWARGSTVGNWVTRLFFSIKSKPSTRFHTVPPRAQPGYAPPPARQHEFILWDIMWEIHILTIVKLTGKRL